MNNYARENKTQALLLILILTAGVIGGILISGGISEEVEAQSTYTSDKNYNIHNDAIKENNLVVIDQNRILTGSRDDTIKIRNIQTDTTELTFNQHTFSVKGVERLSNGKIASISREELYIWDLDTGNIQASYTSVSDANALEKLSDGRLLIGEGNKVLVVDQNGNLDNSFTLNLNSNLIVYAEQLQNGNIAYALNGQPFIVTSDLNGNKINSMTNYKYVNNVMYSLDVADNGNILATSFAGSMELDTNLNILEGTTNTAADDIVQTNNNNILVAGSNEAFILKRSDFSKEAVYEDPGFNYPKSVAQTPDDKIVLGSYSGGVFIYNNLPDITSRVASPVPVTDVQQSSENFTFYAVGNSDVSPSDSLTWEFGDGSTTTANASETVTHNYASHGRYTVNVTTSDGNTRSTEVVVQSKPSVSNIIDPNPALEGESISLDGSGSDALTTAARPAPSQLSVTDGLRSWIPYHDNNQLKDSLYNGFTANGIDASNGLSLNNPTSLYGIYSSSDGDESYLTNPVNFQNEWTISQFVASGSNSIVPIWLSGSGHGVYVDNGDLTRLHPNGTEVIGQVNPSSGGINMTVTHDGTGSFTYYVDGNSIGSDSYSGVVDDTSFLIKAPNSIAGNEQDTDVYIDDWRIYNRVLSNNEIDLIHDSYSVQELNSNKLYYDWTLEGSSISTDSNHTISGLQAGTYSITLSIQDNDGLTNTSTKTLEVKDVVAPRINNLSPIGDQSTRDLDIQADVSHPQLSSNYEVEVQLIRTNQQTGETKTLKTTNITSDQTVSYSADHSDTGVENYDINREYFSYQWTAQEPQQGLSSSKSESYSIPVASVIINDYGPEGLLTDRTVDIYLEVESSTSQDLDVDLQHYDYRDDNLETVYSNTVSSGSNVTYTINHDLNTSSVPSDYKQSNRYNYQWVVTPEGGSSETVTPTVNYRIPGLVYLILENGAVISQDSTIQDYSDSTNVNSVTGSGVHDILDLTNIQQTNEYSGEASTSGRYNSSVFINEYSRSYTALLYDTSDSSVYDQDFSTENGDFLYSEMDAQESYIVLQKEIGGTIYEVAKEPFDVNGNATATVRDGQTYQLSVTDGNITRTLGSWTADNTTDKAVNVEPDPVDLAGDNRYEWNLQSSYNETAGSGTITYTFDSKDSNISDLRIQLVRLNDSLKVYEDKINGQVDNYQTTIPISNPNQTYRFKFTAYDLDNEEEISETRTVTLAYQDVLGELPQWVLTTLAIVLILILTGATGMVSLPWAIFTPVLLSGLFVWIGWLNISMVVIVQAMVLAVLYYASRQDIR